MCKNVKYPAQTPVQKRYLEPQHQNVAEKGNFSMLWLSETFWGREREKKKKEKRKEEERGKKRKKRIISLTLTSQYTISYNTIQT